MADVTLWFNPRCSKCRGADELLRDAGVDLITTVDTGVTAVGESPF